MECSLEQYLFNYGIFAGYVLLQILKDAIDRVLICVKISNQEPQLRNGFYMNIPWCTIMVLFTAIL